MISPDTIARVRERTDIVALVGETVKLVRRGRSHVGLCPFHKEKTPSFHVSPDRGFFHCFGCKESGDVFGFVMKTEGVEFAEAVRRLADRAGVEIEEDRSAEARERAAAARRQEEELHRASEIAAAFYERQLRDHPLARLARDEIARRGLIGPDAPEGAAGALAAFRVGYAPHGWDALALHLRDQGVSPVAGERVGLLVARPGGPGHYDRFRHRLMFPVLDAQGRVVAFSGRVLPDPQTGETPKDTGKYVNSPESPLYHKGETLFGLYQARQAARQAGEAILVEGNFDVVSLHARGLGNVVAPLGTAFTEAQARLLKRHTPAVVVLFDGDAAGRKATLAAREACRAAGLSARVAVLPDGADPDDFARARGPGAVRAVVRAARGMVEHLVDVALDEGFRSGDAAERARRVRDIATIVSSAEDAVAREVAIAYADARIQRLGIPGVGTLRALQSETERALARTRDEGGPEDAGARDARGSSPFQARSPARPADVATAVLGCLLDFPALLDDPVVEQALGALEGDAALAVAALRHARLGPPGSFATEVLARWPVSIHEVASCRLAAPRHERLEDARMELVHNSSKLERLSARRRTSELAEELRRVERAGDAQAEDEILREVGRAARRKYGL